MKTSNRLTLTLLGLLSGTAGLAQEALRFFPVTPCRIVDTRNAPGIVGGPALSHGGVRSFPVANYCGVPSTAKAAALNLTIVSPSGFGHLVVWKYGTPLPLASNLNFTVGEYAIANSAIVPLGANATYQIHAMTALSDAGSAHLIVDVTGYYR